MAMRLTDLGVTNDTMSDAMEKLFHASYIAVQEAEKTPNNLKQSTPVK